MSEEQLQAIENRERTSSPLEDIVDELLEEVRHLAYRLKCARKQAIFDATKE